MEHERENKIGGERIIGKRKDDEKEEKRGKGEIEGEREAERSRSRRGECDQVRFRGS